MKILKHKPLQAKALIDCITDNTRKNIVYLLLSKYDVGMTPTQLSNALDLKLPTISSHLEILEESGIVSYTWSTESGQPSKRYRLRDREIILHIDLEKFTRIPSRSKLETMAVQYVEEKRKEKLERVMSISEISSVLEIDENTAYIVTEYIKENSLDVVIKPLSSLVQDALENRDALSLSEMQELLHVDKYWAEKVCEYLERADLYTFTGQTLQKTKIELSET